MLLAACVAIGGASAVSGATLNDIFGVAERLNAQAKQSQARVDALTEDRAGDHEYHQRHEQPDYELVSLGISGVEHGGRHRPQQVISRLS